MKTTITLLILLISTVAFAEPDWNRGRGWNKAALKYYTNECVSTKMVDVQTEYAAKMLEAVCFEDVLAGRWDKKSRKKYLEDKEQETIIIHKHTQK